MIDASVATTLETEAVFNVALRPCEQVGIPGLVCVRLWVDWELSHNIGVR
jgi:hypothetical protein